MFYFKNEKYLENDIFLLCFVCDGVNILKNINFVKGVFKIFILRNFFLEDVKGISMLLEDEFILFFFILVYLVFCFNFISIY